MLPKNPPNDIEQGWQHLYKRGLKYGGKQTNTYKIVRKIQHVLSDKNYRVVKGIIIQN